MILLTDMRMLHQTARGMLVLLASLGAACTVSRAKDDRQAEGAGPRAAAGLVKTRLEQWLLKGEEPTANDYQLLAAAVGEEVGTWREMVKQLRRSSARSGVSGFEIHSYALMTSAEEDKENGAVWTHALKTARESRSLPVVVVLRGHDRESDVWGHLYVVALVGGQGGELSDVRIVTLLVTPKC